MRTALLLILLLLLIAACAPAAPAELRPPEIHYGEDVCEVCGMIISDAHFASACITADAKGHSFDDIGDMLTFYHLQPEANIRQCFVHDYDTEAWLTADNAYYSVSVNIHSPMGHGIAAFTAREQAETLATETQGAAYTFSELLALNSSGHEPGVRVHQPGA